MTVKLWLGGVDVEEPRVEEVLGMVRVFLNDRDWLTLENRDDCAVLMQAAADADAVFIRQAAHADAVETVAAELAPVDDGWAAPTLHPYDELPPLPQRVPAGPPDDVHTIYLPAREDWGKEHEPPPMPEPQPGGTIYPELTEEALADGEPLESLAPEEEDAQS